MSGYEIVQKLEAFTVSFAFRTVGATAVCPTGKVAVGGGGGSNLEPRLHLVGSGPGTDNGNSSWFVSLGRPDGSAFAVGESVSVSARAVCVNVAS